MIIFATDLDNTLIYSQKKITGEYRCIEWKEGRELSYIPEKSYQKLQGLNKRADIYIIPITTRSLEQYRRITLLEEGPELAIVANGGILLKNGVIDEQWRQESLDWIENCKEELKKAREYLETDENRSFELRNIDDMFLFTKSNYPDITIAGLKRILNPALISIIENYNKIYVIPRILDKGLAIRRLKSYMETYFKEQECPKQEVFMIAAGDSSFDLPMLQEADYAITLKEPCFTEAFIKSNQTYFWDGEKNLFSGYVLETVESIF